MYLMRYSGDTGAGVQTETHLFMSQEAAQSYMKDDFEKERALNAKLGIPYPEKTSEEDEEYYTNISESDIYVYQAGEFMHWEVVEIIPEDLPESLAEAPHQPPAFEHLFPLAVYGAVEGNCGSCAVCDPAEHIEKEDLLDALTEDLGTENPDKMTVFEAGRWVPESVVSRIQVEAIRKFMAGTFKIDPVGYTISRYTCNDIALEVVPKPSFGMFNSREEAVDQAKKDGYKVIPVEELPDGFDRRHTGWIDTPENRQDIQTYCDRQKK